MRHAFGVLARLMARERLTAADAHADAAVELPAIRRMLQEMEDAIPYVDHEGDRPKRFFFSWPHENRTTRHAAASLQLVRELTAFLKGSMLGAGLQSTADEVVARLAPDEPAPDDIARMFLAKTLAMSPQDFDPVTVDGIVSCLFEKRQFECSYEHFNGKQHQLSFQPYTLLFGDEGLYTYGLCTKNVDKKYEGQDRILQVRRITKLVVSSLRSAFPTRDQFDPQRHLQHCWGIFLPPTAVPDCEVQSVLAFSPRWKAHLVSRGHKWHLHQGAPTERADGWIEVPFRVHITQDFVRWVRGYGRSEVRVVSPKRLVRWVEEETDPESGSWG